MKSKIINSIKENKYVLSTGLIALFIIMIIYFCFSIIPFGDKTIYRMDLYHQYGPLFSELYDRISCGESLIYSWNTGLGGAFIGNLFNYLSSPFSFIILLFGHNKTFEAVAAMIAVKAVLSSVSLAYYLKKSHKADGPHIIAFGIMYAFSAYFIAYYWNVMWIDAMYLLPLTVLGIERIIDSGKCSLYLTFLTFSIFTNYYIGFMLCIFSCVYFLYYYFCSYDKISSKSENLRLSDRKFNLFTKSFFLQSGIRFAISSLISAGILIFMLYPVAYILSTSSATSGSNPTEIESYFSIFDFLANHLASLEPTIRSSGDTVMPNIYCGLLTVFLIPFYLFSDKISSREKIASVLLLGFMYLSFNINIFNYIWHGLHFPNDLPYRQSFMYSFILVILAHKAFLNISYFNKKQILSVGLGILAFIVLCQKIGSKNVDDATIIISIIYIILFSVVLGLLVSRKNQTFAITIILVCSVISETILASTNHYVANQTKTAFTEDYDDFKLLQQEIDNNDSELFYRTELSDLRTRMDPSWYDYNGVSVFSSMAYESVANLQKDFGLYGNKINSCTYNPQTPLYNSVFSIKYIYDRKNLISGNDYYNSVGSNATYNVYENPYNLSIAFPVSDEIINWDTEIYSDPIETQNEFFRCATGIENLYEREYNYEFSYNNVYSLDNDSKIIGNFSVMRINEGVDASLTASITASKGGHIYIYISSRQLDDVDVSSEVIETSMDVSDGYIMDLGYYNEGEIVSVKMPIKDDYESANVFFTVFTMSDEKFIDGYNKLKSGQLELSEFEDTSIKGSFTVEENEILFTSIPYDKGWSVIIDGIPASDESIIKISDTLLGIKVDAGEHDIELKYSIPGMDIACLISAWFILLLIIITILKKNKMLIFKNMKDNIWIESEKNFCSPPKANEDNN